MDVLGIIIAIVVGLVLAFGSAGAGYWFRGRTERQRRKNTLLDDRLHRIDAAIAFLEKGSISVYRLDRARPPGGSPERLARAIERTEALNAEGAGIIPRGLDAATELRAARLQATIAEAVGLLNDLSQFDPAVADTLEIKLTEARGQYEALRTELA